MSSNRGVVYVGPGKVEVRDIADPVMASPNGRKLDHAVILKVISTNICGSDQHMVRGRTTAEPGLVLGHEITGEIIGRVATSSSLRSAISYRFRSTLPAGGAGAANRRIPVCA